jgi:hypothetical protein
MRHMKHLSHFAEELAESGQELPFDYPGVDESRELPSALSADLELTQAARDRFVKLDADPELAQHAGLKTEVENMIARNEFLASVVKELLEEAVEQPEAIEPEAAEQPETIEPKVPEGTDKADTSGFTVGSLIDR